ncbi:hypothetical protein [Microbacterium kunmingense]|uniref:hypothetical protein n=1 Tax=Microbacterium kunmingense TaxID=2915939 RepID=UPI0027E38788|nr:hypothetical protein [Microbacterium kunmingense]
MTDIELARIPAGELVRRDVRGRARGVIPIEEFAIGAYPVTEEIVAELIGEGRGAPETARDGAQLVPCRAVVQRGIGVGGPRSGLHVRG